MTWSAKSRLSGKSCAGTALVSDAELSAVPADMLAGFFASPLGVRLLKSEEAHREWAFTYRRETEAGVQLLQGVIDCCFKEKGGWVLLDYKTDSASDIAGALERHRPQIELYAQALSGITGIPGPRTGNLSGARRRGISGIKFTQCLDNGGK